MKEEVNYKQQLLDLINGINDLGNFAVMQNSKGRITIETVHETDSIGNPTLDTIIAFEDADKMPFIRCMAEIADGCIMPIEVFERNHWKQVYNDFLIHLLFAKDNKNEKRIDPESGEVIRCIPVGTLLKEGYKNN